MKILFIDSAHPSLKKELEKKSSPVAVYQMDLSNAKDVKSVVDKFTASSLNSF